MSVFHGVRDIGAMPSGTLARLARRIAVYDGAVGARFGHAAQQAVPPAPPQESAAAAPQPPRRPPPGTPASAAELTRLLAPVAGSRIWGTVREVKPEDQDS